MTLFQIEKLATLSPSSWSARAARVFGDDERCARDPGPRWCVCHLLGLVGTVNEVVSAVGHVDIVPKP